MNWSLLGTLGNLLLSASSVYPLLPRGGSKLAGRLLKQSCPCHSMHSNLQRLPREHAALSMQALYCLVRYVSFNSFKHNLRAGLRSKND
jgi:hypothetical protein